MKKSKLLLSLAMICLSIAVLCFGVLAATSVTYSISGTISYEVSDVFVKINTSVYGVAAQQDKTTVITNVKALETTELSSINTSIYTLTQTMIEYDSTNASGTTATHTAQDNNSKGVEIVYGTYYTYYIVINIQNLSSSKNVNAVLTDNTTAELNSIKTTNLYQNNIASTETKNIVIAYSIKDKTSSVNSAAISYSLKVSYDLYTDPITFTNDTTNKGYFISLGTYSSSPIQWKLVSLDGVNRYDYTDGTDNLEARYLSGAIFIQETYTTKMKFDTNNSNVYSESDIRTFVSTASNWGLNNFPDYIVAYIDMDETNGVVNGDRFWLLSSDQAATILVGDETFGTPVSFDGYWLRTEKGVVDEYKCACALIYQSWVPRWVNLNEPVTMEHQIRAAFQLA